MAGDAYGQFSRSGARTASGRITNAPPTNPVACPVDYCPENYTALRAQTCTVGEQAQIQQGNTAGTFNCVAADPYGDGDDGGIVFDEGNDAANEWWSRVFSHNAADPLQLDWYEVSDEQDITTLLDNRFTGLGGSTDLFVKMPTSTMTLRIDELTWGGIDSLYILESDVLVTLKHVNTPTDAASMFDLTDFNVIVLGTTENRTLASNSFGNKLRFHGNTENSLGHGDDSRQGFFETSTDADALKMIVHADFYWTPYSGYVNASGAVAAGIDTIDVRSIMHQSGVQLSQAWDYTFIDAVITDPMGRGPGWDGTTNADNCDWPSIGQAKNYNFNPQDGGAGSKIEGHIRLKYGRASFIAITVEYVGNSTSDRFVIESDSIMYAGDGTRIKNSCGTANQIWKSDSFGYTGYGERFIKAIVGGTTGDTDGYFWQQQACSNGARDTDHVDYEVETAADFSAFESEYVIHGNRQDAACTGSDVLQGSKYRGSSATEPGDKISIRMADRDTVFSGTWHSIYIRESVDNSAIPVPTNSRIENSTVEVNIFIDADATGTSLESVTMPSTATITANATFDCGSQGTIGTGTYSLSNSGDRTTLGATGSDPYTICNP